MRRAVRWRWSLVVAVWLSMLSGRGGCGAQTPAWPLWEAYANRFLDQQGRVIDHNAADRTTTEGESYAMFFALVANDRPRFERLLDWTENNMAQGDLTLHLPAWSWGRASDGSWRVLDSNPAADADLWMAYTLCEAGRLWHVDRYAKLGRLMADAIAHQEIVLIPGLGRTMIPSVQGFHPDAHTWYVNPSYLAPETLAYFAHEEPLLAWGEVLRTLPKVVRTPGGYAMDWMKATEAVVQASATPAADQAVAGRQQPGSSARGSYDAIRVYLWLGMADPRTPGVREALRALPGMALWLKDHPAPPLVVEANGQATLPDSPPGFSAAVIPYLHALGKMELEKKQADRLAATRDVRSGFYGRDAWYYDQNLGLFATGWSERRFRFNEQGALTLAWK